MSHEIESIAYDKGVPWHGLGYKVTNLTPDQMLQAANLDWTVSKRPIFVAEHPNFKTLPTLYNLPFPNLFALVRDSDNRVLGPCGPRYTPFQNSEVMDFFNKFTEAGHMQMEVAGSLKGGTWIWALARILDGSFDLMGGDMNYTYLLLVSPHVWSEAATIMFTSVRVVCWNTLTRALNKKITEKFRLLHTQPFSQLKDVAQISVEQAMLEKQIFAAKAKVLAESKVKMYTDVYRYYGQLVLRKTKAEVDTIDILELGKSRGVHTMMSNYHAGPGARLESANGTWWGAFNGVTRYIDHQKGRGDRGQALYNAWLAHSDAVTKRKALELAYEYAIAT